MARSLLRAFNLSADLRVRVATPLCLDSRISGLDGAACVASLIVPVLVPFCGALGGGAGDQLRKFAKMTNTLVIAARVGGYSFRQNIHARAVQKIFLKAKLAFALRKLFERQFAVESDHMRVNSPSRWDSTMRPSAKSSRVNSAVVFVGRFTRSVRPIPNSITRLSS